MATPPTTGSAASNRFHKKTRANSCLPRNQGSFHQQIAIGFLDETTFWQTKKSQIGLALILQLFHCKFSTCINSFHFDKCSQTLNLVKVEFDIADPINLSFFVHDNFHSELLAQNVLQCLARLVFVQDNL